jgi:hypothetical protein
VAGGLLNAMAAVGACIRKWLCYSAGKKGEQVGTNEDVKDAKGDLDEKLQVDDEEVG